MANRYWVGGAANWDATAGSKWALTSGGAGGQAVPTAADDVFLDNGTGHGNVTISAAAVCRSLNCTNYADTLAGGFGLTIGDGTAGASNVALKFVAGMTQNYTGTITFASTSATQQTVDFAGKTTGAVTFNAASGGSWQYTGAHTSTGSLTLTMGALDINGQTCQWQSLSSGGSSTRSLTLGAAAITVTGFHSLNSTGLTLSAASSTITFTGSSTSFTSNGSLTYGTVNFTGSGAPSIGGTGPSIFGTLTRTGTAVKGDGLSVGSDFTVSGTLTINGNSSTNRVLVKSGTVGTARTITAATVSCSNVDFRDIVGAGAGSWDLSAISGLSGDCGGNSNITFTTPTTQTATGASSFTWSTHGWTTRVPLPQDTALIPNAFSASQTVTMDMPRYGTVSFAGCTGAPAVTFSATWDVYGDLTLAASMGTVTLGAYFVGAATQTLTTAGNSLAGSGSITALRSKLVLADALTTTAALDTSGSGYIDTQSFAVSCGSHSAGNSSGVNLYGTSTITTTSTTTGVSLTAAVCSAASASFVIGSVSSSSRTFSIGGATINSLTYTVAGSTGGLTLSGSGTIGTLNFSDVSNARTLTFAAAQTITITTAFNVNGTSGKLMTMTIPFGSAYTISKASGVVSCDYLSIKDSTASGGATFYAGANSTNVSGNTGWIFTAAPATSSPKFGFDNPRRRSTRR